MVRLSVIMPVHNGEPFLRTAIASIQAQTYADFEFIIIDDGSTDGSAAIIEEAARDDGRLLPITLPSARGVAAALNDGLRRAAGDLVARMDADDIALPERLARQVAFLDTHPETALCGTQVAHIDERGAPVDLAWRKAEAPAEIHRVLRTRWNCIVHSTVCMRKAIVLDLGGYDPAAEPAEDFDLWLRLSRRAPLANLGDTLLLYRHHDRQVSVGRAAAQTASHDAALRRDAAQGSGEVAPVPGARA